MAYRSSPKVPGVAHGGSVVLAIQPLGAMETFGTEGACAKGGCIAKGWGRGDNQILFFRLENAGDVAKVFPPPLPLLPGRKNPL